MALDARGVNREKKRLQAEYKKRVKEIEKDRIYEEELYEREWELAPLDKERSRQMHEHNVLRRKGIISFKKYLKCVSKTNREYRQARKKIITGTDKIEKIKEKYKNADALLTATERTSIYNYSINNNILIFGGSGCGKTRGFVCPNALQAHSSYVFTDPKGEILTKTGKFLKEHEGYEIRVLNLDSPSDSDYYNPFHYLHPERQGFEERVITLIDTIIMNTNGGENKGSSDPFWEQAEKCFLQALFFFTACYFPPDKRNIATCLELLSWLKLEEEGDNKDSMLDWWVRERFIPKFGNKHIGVQQYNEFRDKASGKTAKSIVMTSVARFAPFRTKEISRILSADTMNLEDLGEKKMAVFVVVPPTNNPFTFMSGMLFTQMFQELQYCATQVHKEEGQRLPVMVRFILDEFANTCKIPNFEKIIAYARSFGIGICPILQSLEQIKAMYEKSWGTIIDNCSCLLYLGNVKHPETLEYLVKLVGKGTFDKKTTSRSRGRNGSSSTSFDKIGRELLDMSEIQTLPRDECLLFITGRPAFWSKKYDYTSHPNYMYTNDANSDYYFDYHPIVIETPEEKRAIELDKKIREEDERKRKEKEEEAKKEYLRKVSRKRVNEIISGINDSLDMVTSLGDTQMLASFRNNRSQFIPIPTDSVVTEAEAYELLQDDTRREGILDLIDSGNDDGFADSINNAYGSSTINSTEESTEVIADNNTVDTVEVVVEVVNDNTIEESSDTGDYSDNTNAQSSYSENYSELFGDDDDDFSDTTINAYKASSIEKIDKIIEDIEQERAEILSEDKAQQAVETIQSQSQSDDVNFDVLDNLLFMSNKTEQVFDGDNNDDDMNGLSDSLFDMDISELDLSSGMTDDAPSDL